MALPGSRRQTWDECFSTACIWFLWQAVVQAALEFLGFGSTVEQLMGLRVDVCSSCAWFSFDSWCSGIFLLDVSESPGNFAHIPIYGHKDDFPLPLTNIFFVCPAACIAIQAFHSCMNCPLVKVSAAVPGARLTLKKTGSSAARKLEIAGGSHYSSFMLILLNQ